MQGVSVSGEATFRFMSYVALPAERLRQASRFLRLHGAAEDATCKQHQEQRSRDSKRLRKKKHISTPSLSERIRPSRSSICSR